MNELGADGVWEVAFAFENALLDQKPEVVRSHILQSVTHLDGTLYIAAVTQLKDLHPTLDLRHVRASFELLCGGYLVQDYSLIDLRKIADICIHYPLSVIEPVVKRCKAQQVFTISYLAAALASEASADIEELRRESRLDEIAARSKPSALPPSRDPGPLLNCDPQGAAQRARIERTIEQHYKDLHE